MGEGEKEEDDDDEEEYADEDEKMRRRRRRRRKTRRRRKRRRRWFAGAGGGLTIFLYVFPPTLWATGGLTIFVFPLPQHLLPFFFGGVPLPPYPRPWTWTGRFAKCRGGGPVWPKMVPKGLQRTQDDLQYGPI